MAILLPLLALGPGHLMVRGLGLRAGAHLVAAVGAGLLGVFLAVFGLFALRVDPRAYWGVGGACVVAWGVGGRGIWGKVRGRRVRGLIAGWGIVVGVSAALMLPLRHISGGNWIVDWHEHYSRAEYFLGRLPDETKFAKVYALPARPPMQNVLVAFAAAHDSGDPRGVALDFRTDQLCALALGSLAYLPCALLAGGWARGAAVGRRGRTEIIVALAFALAPSFAFHVLFPWTKLFSAFYVALGVYLYVGPARWGRSGGRMVAAAVALGAGMVVHYSAAPFALVVGAHYLVGAVRRREIARGLRTVAVGLVPAVAWVGWSVAVFGVGVTFGANSTVADARGRGAGELLGVLGTNAVRTFVPHTGLMSTEAFVRGTHAFSASVPAPSFVQNSALGTWRDYMVADYAGTIMLCAGTGGAVVLTARLTGAVRRRGFWLYFVVASGALSMASCATPNHFGVAQVSMVPLAVLAIAFVGARLGGLPAWGRAGAVLAMGFDAFGVIYPDVVAQSRVFKMVVAADGSARVMRDGETLSNLALGQFRLKEIHGLRMWGDLWGNGGTVMLGVSLGALVVAWAGMGWALRSGTGGAGRRLTSRGEGPG